MASSLKDKIKDATTDEVEVDFSEAREGLGDLEPTPIGTYEAYVIECDPGTSKAGNPMVVFKFELEEHERTPGTWPTAFRNAPTTGAGSGIFRDTAEALGFDIAALESGKEKFRCSEAIDRKCLIVVGNRKDGSGTEIKRVKARVGAAKATGATKAIAGRRRVG